MHGIGRGRGSRVDAVEGMQTKVALRQRSGEHVCVLRWTYLTTCDVSTSLEEFICQIRARKEIILWIVVQRSAQGAVKRKDNLCVKNKIK